MKKEFNTSFSSKRFRNGAYSSAVTVIVLIVLLFINLVAGRLDLKVDVSTSGYFTMSETTGDFLEDLDEDIVIYYLSTEAQIDTMVKDMIDKYDSASKHITVEMKDFELYPNFVYQYVDEGTSVYYNSVIVENVATGRSRYIGYYDMVLYKYNNNYQPYLTGYDVEGQITSAIQYVTTDELPKVYATTGHGELYPTGYAAEYLTKQNIQMETLETLTMEAVPADCEALMIFGATQDFTEQETAKILEYMENGGNVIVYMDYVEANLNNLMGLLAHYGVGVEPGIVLETDAAHMINNIPYYVVPDIINHEITEGGKAYAGTYMPQGLTIDADIRGSVERSGLLKTSDNAFSKTNMEEATFSMGDEDIAGPFYLGVVAVEEFKEVESKLIVYSGTAMIDDNFMGVSSLANANLFTDTINWVVDREETVLSIPTKEYTQSYLTLTSADVNTLTIILVIVLPVAILACGGVVWFKRRKK